MSTESKQIEKQEYPPRNLITHFNETVEAMVQLEGKSWLEIDERIKDQGGDLRETVFGAVEKIKKLSPEDLEEISPGFSIYTIYGSGGVHRYYVMKNGEVMFSQHHGMGQVSKAQSLGFKIFE